MIVVDSSAAIAILFNEAEAIRLGTRLAAEPRGERFMSAASYVETGTVLAGRIKGERSAAIADLDAFLTQAGIGLVEVDPVQARIALTARINYERGFGGAGKLNYGDAFSYSLAKTLDAPLLFVGDDFVATDVKIALPGFTAA